MTRRIRLPSAAWMALAATCVPAQAQDADLRRWLGPPKAVPPATVMQTPAAPAAEPGRDAGYEAAKRTFEGLPEPLRRAVQDALVWTGDYNGATTGSFGRRTYEGIQAWQRHAGLPPTGVLSAGDRVALDAASEAARRAVRFAVRSDPASGTRIGVPDALLTKRTALARGTRWQSGDGRITLDTAAYPPGGAELGTLFARAAAASPERSVTYTLMKPDFFVATGETATGRFYIRHAAGPEGIRGFTMSYDKALAGEVDRLVIAVANSFVPFPEAAPPTPAASGSAAATVALPPLPGEPASPAATGLALGDGRVLTTVGALASCPSPSVGSVPARIVAGDPAGVLALLAVEWAPVGKPAMPPIRDDAPASGEALVVLGAQAKGPAVIAPGIAERDGISGPLQPGAGGAPVLDRSGRLVGLVARFPDRPRLVAGVAPPTRYAVVPASAVAAFLTRVGIALPQADPSQAAGTLGAAAGPVLGSIAAISCGR